MTNELLGNNQKVEVNPSTIAKALDECYSQNHKPSLIGLRDALMVYHAQSDSSSYEKLKEIVESELLVCARAADLSNDLECKVEDILVNSKGITQMMKEDYPDGPIVKWYQEVIGVYKSLNKKIVK